MDTNYHAHQTPQFRALSDRQSEKIYQAAHLAQKESNPRSSSIRALREYRLATIPSLISDALNVAAERAKKDDAYCVKRAASCFYALRNKGL